MHDFIQSQSFSLSRAPYVVRPAPAEWVQRGIMRSFGEDEVVAPYRTSPRLSDRSNRKSKVSPRK